MWTDANGRPCSGARAYDVFMGRWSRIVARDFVRWLSPLPHHRWLDVGCGTGALTVAILELATPRQVCCLDLSDDYMSFARNSLSMAHCFVVADATALPAGAGSFDVAVSGLALNLVSAPVAAISEMVRVLDSGGVAAAYVWDFADGMQLFRLFWDAAAKLNPRAADLDQATQFPWCRPEGLRSLFEGAALEGVDVHSIEVSLQFAQFEDYWTPLLTGHGRVPGYVTSLSAAERSALQESLRAGLPTGRDGSIRLTARAWAVRGTRAQAA